MDPSTTETAASTNKRRNFTSEFREAAVRLVSQEGYSFKAAAKAVGVGEQSLRQWHAKLSPKPASCGDDATIEQLRAENRRLQRQLRQAELEREILKKATAYFAKESL
jgi:transposase